MTHHDRQRRLDPPRVRYSDHRGVGHRRVREQDTFDLGGVDVLATAHDQVLLAIDEPEIPVVVTPGEIATVEPVARERLRGRLRLAVVARHHVRPAVDDLTDLARTASRNSSSTTRSSTPNIGLPTEPILRVASAPLSSVVAPAISVCP